MNPKKLIANLPRGVQVHETTNGHGRTYFRVRLGKKFTGGPVRKRDFSLLRDAREWVFGPAKDEKAQPGSVIELKRQSGASAFALTSDRLHEAFAAFRMLEGVASLTDAVQYYIRHVCPSGGRRTFAEVAALFIASRERKLCKDTTLVQYRQHVNTMGATWNERAISEIKRAEIEDWIEDSTWKPRTRNNYLTTMSTVFEYAIGQEFCCENPVLRIERALLDDTEPGFLTPPQASNLLESAAAEDVALIPSIAIGLFAGVRRSELALLQWEHVNLEEKEIVIPPEIAKTRSKRVITMAKNLPSWLKPFARPSGGLGFDVDSFGLRLRRLVRGSETRSPIMDEWPHNGLRHSYGSYFYASTNNETITAAMMGNSPQVVHQNYRTIVPTKDVLAFWRICPPRGMLPRKVSAKCPQ